VENHRIGTSPRERRITVAYIPDISEQLTGDEKQILDEMVARRKKAGGALVGPFVPLMSHIELSKYVERLGFYLKYESTLPRTIYEFTILSVASTLKGAFVWNDHVVHARIAGLPEEIISAVQGGKRELLPNPYSLVSEAVATAMIPQSIPDRLQESLISLYGVKGFLEIITLCGFYRLVNQLIICCDVPLPKSATPPF